MTDQERNDVKREALEELVAAIKGGDPVGNNTCWTNYHQIEAYSKRTYPRVPEPVTVTLSTGGWAYAPHINTIAPWTRMEDGVQCAGTRGSARNGKSVLTADDHEKCAAAIRAYESRR